MSKVKYFYGDQEVKLPPRGRGVEAFGDVPPELKRPPTVRPLSEIHTQIAEVIGHEHLGGVAHVDEIQAGLFHLFGKPYKLSQLYGHLANAVKNGIIHKLEGRLGYYSTVPIEARPSKPASAPAEAEAEAVPAHVPVRVARPVAGPTHKPSVIGRTIR